jgi:hypothetical protein
VSCLHGRQLLYLHGVGNRSSPRVGGGACALGFCCVSGPTRQSELNLSCEAELVVRGGDLFCEAETSRGDPSSGELVGDAVNWPKTGRLASVGLDQGHLSCCLLLSCVTAFDTWCGHTTRGGFQLVRGCMLEAT